MSRAPIFVFVAKLHIFLPIFCSFSRMTAGAFFSVSHAYTPFSRLLGCCTSRSTIIHRSSSSPIPRFRLLSASAENTADINANNQQERQHIVQAETKTTNDLIDPMILVNYTIPFPKSLSPSSAAEFMACPQSYFFQYLLGIKQPTNEALAKGTMCHAALQKIFDLPPLERTLDALKDLLRSCWKEKRNKPPYNELFKAASNTEAPEKPIIHFPMASSSTADDSTTTKLRIRDPEAERKWGTGALKLLDNYYELEDPRTVLPPNPHRREMWITFNLTVNPTRGATFRGATIRTSPIVNDNNLTVGQNKQSEYQQHFLMRGIIDRLDYVRLKDGQTALRVADYKTAKSPNFKYSKAMNEKIAEQNFWQLKIYALLLHEKMLSGEENSTVRDNSNAAVRVLRLMYLTSDNGKAQYIDMDLGETQEQRDAILQNVHVDLSNIWVQICNLVKLQDARAFVHCDRSFCFCHRVRPYFKAGMVWERNKPTAADISH